MTEFKHEDYPSLYQVSDKVSNDTQATYLRLMKFNIFLLIIASIFSYVGINSTIMAVFSAIVFFITLIINVVLMTKNYPDTWYKARSIAESIKTTTWRFIMKAEPFTESTIHENSEKFTQIIRAILQEAKDIADKFDPQYHLSPMITDAMKSSLALNFQDKASLYLKERIQEQRQWYADKTGYNQRVYQGWFWTMIGLQVIAIVLVLTRIAYPAISYLSPEILSVMIASILTWIQLKKYRELSASYSFTAHEIGIIESKFENIKTVNDLSRFVQDAENAFSREHTQWIARKDH